MLRSRKLIALTMILCAGAAGLGALGSPAGADPVGYNTVTQNANGVTVWTGGNEMNRVNVTVSGTSVIVTDTTADITATAPCVRTGFGRASCPATRTTDVELWGRDGNDDLFGGPGNDVIDGGNGNGIIFGVEGNDWITAGAGNDYLFGGTGNDTLEGGAGDVNWRAEGQDTLSGGTGWDWVTYLAKGNRVVVTLDDIANDGVRAYDEADNVGSDVEAVTGTRYDDILVGNNADNAVYGTWGDDLIDGLGGNDRLYGELGWDHLWGGTGNDALYQKYGSSNFALPIGLPAPASGDGNDQGSECGTGTDTVFLDYDDPAAIGCETVNVSSPWYAIRF